jgi:hypothetical protein
VFIFASIQSQPRYNGSPMLRLNVSPLADGVIVYVKEAGLEQKSPNIKSEKNEVHR